MNVDREMDRKDFLKLSGSLLALILISKFSTLSETLGLKSSLPKERENNYGHMTYGNKPRP